MNSKLKDLITCGNTALGIELGSTRIKAVLTGPCGEVLATGGHEWENRLEHGVWTYHLDEVYTGLASAYKALAENVQQTYGLPLQTAGALGISAMMHGYLVFDKNGKQLVPFRTWRNTMTEQAAEEITALFNFNIPQRWSIAHLYQAMLRHEEHLPQIATMTTLAGHVHFLLTGQHVLGLCEASGMFPIDSQIGSYHAGMVEKFNAKLQEHNLPYRLQDILPNVLPAGQTAGSLTAEGAKLLDPTGTLQPGIALCPPEGDATTGMVATNSISERTGNISAGTSVFAMAVLEKPLSKVYPEVDLITTPAGSPVAMVHCNNCTSDLNAWADLLCEFATAAGTPMKKGKVLDILFENALAGEADCGGLFACNYLSGEHITGFTEGRPLFARLPDAKFSFANFARAQVYATIVSLKMGMDILLEQEQVTLERLLGHGGFFKAEAGKQILATLLGVPVAVTETAAEGGAWGMALLASYCKNKAQGETLGSFLQNKIFNNTATRTAEPNQAEKAGFEAYLTRFKAGLAVEQAAIEAFQN